MLRGRMGAVGGAFHLGEMTVTRCSVRLAEGPDGHAYVRGRDKKMALVAALFGGLMQTQAAPHIQHAIQKPLQDAHETHQAARAGKAAATKVGFFTMV